MSKFKTLEEAEKAFISILDQKKISDEKVKSLEKENKVLLKRATDAEETAKDAISKVNSLPSDDRLIVSVGKNKYEVNFGVDGKSKEELSKDSELLKKLVEKGSAAISLVD